MKKVLFFFIAFLMTSSGAFALSDAEYQYLLKTSPEYRQAEAQLARAWKHAYGYLKRTAGMARREVLDEQRDWIARTRDIEARACMQRGMSRAKAYAKVTRDRAAYLDSFGR